MTPVAFIKTARLPLRAPHPSDLAPFVATMTPDRLTYIQGDALDRPAAARLLAQYAGTWVLRGTGPMIWERDGAPIGHGGIFWPLHEDAPELGWVIWRSADEGKGYATEAMRAIIEDAAARLDLTGLWAGIHPDNARSHQLATRLGLHRSTDRDEDGFHVYRSAQ